MRDAANLEKIINKFANGIRLIGVLMVMSSSIAAVSYTAEGQAFWDQFRVSLLFIGVSGLLMILIGGILYRILIVNGQYTTHRIFPFKDED